METRCAALRLGGMEIVPVERADVHRGEGWLVASRRCVALIVRDESGERRIDIPWA